MLKAIRNKNIQLSSQHLDNMHKLRSLHESITSKQDCVEDTNTPDFNTNTNMNNYNNNSMSINNTIVSNNTIILN